MKDTSAAADERHHELLRALPPERRLEAAMRLTRAVRTLAVMGILHRHPTASEEEVRIRFTVRLYGRPTAQTLFGTVPDDAL